MDTEEGGGAEWQPPPLKNHKNIGFLSSTRPDPLKFSKTLKAIKPAFSFGILLARQRNAIKMAFRWLADNGQLLVVIGFSLPN